MIKEEFNKGVMGYVQTMTDSKKCHEKAVKAHDTRLTRGNDIATINKKKADDHAVNEFGMVPALPSQKIAVFSVLIQTVTIRGLLNIRTTTMERKRLLFRNVINSLEAAKGVRKL